MLGVSVACTITLLFQEANLIASAIVKNRDAFTTVIVTVLIELASMALILYLFNPTSEFVKGIYPCPLENPETRQR